MSVCVYVFLPACASWVMGEWEMCDVKQEYFFPGALLQDSASLQDSLFSLVPHSRIVSSAVGKHA